MLSLRDKLKAAGVAKPAKETKSAARDCLIRETRVPVARFALAREISGASLEMVQGQPYPDCRREDFCFLDTETTGLSHGAGTVAFLVGVGFFDETAFVVRQYLMRDYDEEAFVLSRVAEDMARSKVLCTFNGQTFDLPLLEVRFTMQRMREQFARRPHVDLLPASRRVWKLRLKRCNLTSLEEAVLGMQRQDDLERKMIRLHVIANSDDPADQALKLQVRDRVLAESGRLVPAGADAARRRAASSPWTKGRNG